MRKSSFFIFITGFFVCCAPAIAARITDDPEVASNIKLLEAWIESKLAYDSQPALNIGIVCDQELVWAKSFGYADLENKKPASLDDIYRIGSQSKMFTALAVLKLVDEGKLSLDDPVERHLPWFKMKNKYPDAPSITIRHLLTHTAGIPQEANFPYWTDYNFPEKEQIIAALPGQETVYPAETKWKYSNLGYVLAGEIVSAASGMAYAEYIQRNFLGPFGMTSTSVSIPEEQKRRLVKGYSRRLPDGSRKLMPFTDAKGIAACGGFSSTVGDLARFASWMFRLRERGGKEILNSSTLKQMQRVHWLFPDWSGGWGLGFGITHTKERDIVFHGGWVAGYKTNFSLSLGEKVAVIALQNTDDATTLVVDKVFAWVVPSIIKATAITPETFETDPQWTKLAGCYRWNWIDTQVMIYKGKLVLIDLTKADPVSSMFILLPVSENTFRIEGESWGSHGELVSFEFGSDGEVTKMYVGSNYKYRVK